MIGRSGPLRSFIALAGTALVAACSGLPPVAAAPATRTYGAAGDPGRVETGEASYYADSLAGRRTASGVPYRPSEMIAAHRTLPFGTRLRVTNLANGRVAEVRVIDRGPYAKGRVLDLSRRAAEELDFIERGHTRVRIEVLND